MRGQAAQARQRAQEPGGMLAARAQARTRMRGHAGTGETARASARRASTYDAGRARTRKAQRASLCKAVACADAQKPRGQACARRS
eukprot:15004049-Alexandrium_andersonii.AAC.1